MQDTKIADPLNPNPNLDEDTEDPEMDKQLQQLVQQQLTHLNKSLNNPPSYPYPSQPHHHNPNPSNVYFDKHLKHLVIQQQFNFQKISQILTQAFKEYRIDTSERACRLRWAYFHKNRNQLALLREKEKEDKRERSVAAFSSPYSLYSVDQLIENLEKREKEKLKQGTQTQTKVLEPVHTGYNIFKDSFRRIDNLQQHQKLQQKMKQALSLAQQQTYTQKPLFFSPQYQNLQQFQVKSQELTADKVRQLMAYQIEMEKISREFQVRKEEDQERKYEEIIRRRMEREKQEKEGKGSGKAKGSLSAEIQENWDQYESD